VSETVIQVVFVIWGTRYHAAHVNGMRRAISQNTRKEVRFYCITDTPDRDWDREINVRSFPDFGLPLDTLKSGCRAKLSIFAPGIVDDVNAPTILFDLDTLVCGDVSSLADLLNGEGEIFFLKNHYVPVWKFHTLARLIAPNYYYFGNSSILIFRPKDYFPLFDSFMQAMLHPVKSLEKSVVSDERYISSFAWGKTRVIPNSLAVRFSHEFMAPIAFFESIRRKVPWVKRRRTKLVAVTFSGIDLKPDRIAIVKEGELVREKRQKTRWAYPAFTGYWSEIEKMRQTEK
jgi:hypothetical protein